MGEGAKTHVLPGPHQASHSGHSQPQRPYTRDRPALPKMGCSLKAGLHKGLLYIAPAEAAQHGIMQACCRWTHPFETPPPFCRRTTRTSLQHVVYTRGGGSGIMALQILSPGGVSTRVAKLGKGPFFIGH